jgi:hypothetical protein
MFPPNLYLLNYFNFKLAQIKLYIIFNDMIAKVKKFNPQSLFKFHQISLQYVLELFFLQI